MAPPRRERPSGLDIRLARVRETASRCCFCLRAPSVHFWGDLAGWCEPCNQHVGRLARTTPPAAEPVAPLPAPTPTDPVEVAATTLLATPDMAPDLAERYRAELAYGLERWSNLRQAVSHAQAVVEVLRHKRETVASVGEAGRAARDVATSADPERPRVRARSDRGHPDRG